MPQPPSTQTIDKNYYKAPTETVDQYNARIQSYNTSKVSPVDPFKPTPPASTGTQTTLAQDQAKAANQGKPGYDALGNPIASASTSSPSAPASKTPQGELSEAQAQRAAADAAYQAEAQRVSNVITNIQNGTTPLTPGQQAQIDGLKAQFQAMIDQQTLINTGASGLGNIRGYQKGAGEYDPTFQVKTIGAIMSAGQGKIADLNTKMASAVAALTQSFHDNDIKAVTEAWKTYSDAAKSHQDYLQQTVEDAQAAIKEAREAAEKEQERRDAEEKNYYERNIKPIQEIAKDAAKNGASEAVLAAINEATTVQDAISAAGNMLQTATGDAGAYLFAKRQADSSGKAFPDFDTWSKQLEDRKIASELAKFAAQEEIRYKYDLALENAKNAIANAPNPDYHGEFEATIKLAAQAGSTNAQRTQIKNDLEDFISSGDYKSAYTQILSSASAKLTGANASNFQQQQQSYESLKEMRQALIEYRAAGGDTNILKGGADAIQTKIGVLATDPKYAAIATRLNSAYQQYRQNMTGAAFGVKEAAQYASVLPSAGNTFALNMAKLDGAEAYLNSVVESTIKNTIGEGGIYIKQYAEATDQALNKQGTLQDKLTEFRASSPDNEAMIQEIHAAFPNWTMEQVAEEVGLSL